jgi:hypothetical protein
MTKITPEIEKFIADNHLMTCRSLVALIEEKFQIKVAFKTVNNHLEAARADATSKNSAKVEAVRSAVLDDAERYAEKYLKILDRDIEAWDSFLTSGVLVFPKAEGEPEARKIKIDSAKDRSIASQSLQKCIGIVLDFAKPNPGVNVNINDDLKTRMTKYKDYFAGLEDDARRKGTIGGNGS